MATTLETGHVGLNVTELDRSIAFYGEVFTLDVIAASRGDDRYALLGRGGAPILTLWQQSSERFVTDRPGLHHLSFRASSIEAVRAAEQRARSAGATILHGGVVSHGEGLDSGGVFFEDPDGIRLEVFTASGVHEHAAPSGAAPTCGFF
jgi:catechol 2,3-dioxygenase-like lactoylglutathione lyase family enzyme